MLPPSYTNPKVLEEIPRINRLQSFNDSKKAYYKSRKSKSVKGSGVKPSTYISDKDGSWIELADGFLWRSRFNVEKAKSMALSFRASKKFSEKDLWITNSDGQSFRGPFHLEEGQEFDTPIIFDHEVVFEAQFEEQEEFEIEITDVFSTRDNFLHARPSVCHPSVLCDSADFFREQTNACVFFAFGRRGIGTGVLLNNMAKDGTGYVLTAGHHGITKNSAADMTFWWQYHRPCGEHGNIESRIHPGGAEIVAQLNDHDKQVDFMLLRLKQKPQLESGAYYAGWDLRGNRPNSVVSVYHPDGRPQAIAIYDHPVEITEEKSETPGPGKFWYIPRWDSGQPLDNSSGSGLWDRESKRIIGQLTSGRERCVRSRGPHWYGMLSESIQAGEEGQKLLKALNPNGDDILHMDGQSVEELNEERSFHFSEEAAYETGEIESFAASLVMRKLHVRAPRRRMDLDQDFKPSIHVVTDKESFDSLLSEQYQTRLSQLDFLVVLKPFRKPRIYEVKEVFINALQKTNWESYAEDLRVFDF